MKPSAYLLVAALCLSACSNRPALEPGPQLTLVASDELPAPAGSVAGSETRTFRVGPFDKLSVSVFGIPELSQTVQVDAAGRVALPLVGSIQAAGLTPSQISEQVAQGLRGRYVRDPQVAVNVDETASQVITIDGQVTEPGVYPALGRMTLIRAIASAKGTGEFAKLEDVVVFRKVGDRQMAALYNLDAIRRGSYGDPEVYPNDVIVVGDSPSRRLFRDFLQASPILVAPLIAVLQR